MTSSILKLVVVTAVVAVGCSTSLAANYAADFSTVSNPGNGWSYGFNDIAVGGGNDMANDVLFALFHDNTAGNAGDRWTGDGTLDTAYPPNDVMLCNLGDGDTAWGGHWDGGSIGWEAGVAYHTWARTNLEEKANGLTGDDMIFSTYTIPAAGLYDITGTWTENGNSGGATVDVLVNGASLGASHIDLDVEGDSTTIQSLGIALAMGDTVSFRTLRDTDYPNGGSARLDATVVAVPEPASLIMAGLALAGVAVASRRRRSR